MSNNHGFNFKTTHELEFKVSEQSPFPGYAAFALGGIAGFFSVPEMTIDWMVGDITIPIHIVDAVEWFDEMAREENYIGVRLMNCTNRDLMSVLIHRHGYKAIKSDVLFKQVIRKN